MEEVRFGLADIPGVPPRLMKMLVQLMGETALGLCDLAVVEPGWRQHGPPPFPPARSASKGALPQQANVPSSDPENRHDDDEADE